MHKCKRSAGERDLSPDGIRSVGWVHMYAALYGKEIVNQHRQQIEWGIIIVCLS